MITAKAADKAGNNTESEQVSFTVDGLPGKPSEITCNLSNSDVMVIGEPLQISGNILPEPGTSVSGVNIALTSPGGELLNIPVLANIKGEFFYELPCGVILEEGKWIIQASWSGNRNFKEAESKAQILEVSKAESDIRLDVTSESIKVGEKVTISGKFLPRPYCNGGIQDISISFILTSPDGAESTFSSDTDEKGHFKSENFSGFNSLGRWKIKAEFKGNNAYNLSESQLLEVNVRETAGYAIIVQGKISSDEGVKAHQKTADFVYKTLKDRYLLDEDIKYFNYDENPSENMEIDGIPSKEGIKKAITQWAKDKMNKKPANLYIIMLDHGFNDKFFIDPETVTAKELKEWLDTLQDSLTGDASEQEIGIILGFCRSGSFIDDLSGENRVIVTSAAENESSYKGALDQDNIREGEFFISELFKAVSYGKSLKKSFQEAAVLTEKFTYSEIADDTEPPYYDKALQHPLLDDNRDGKGSNDLSDPGGDGKFSKDIIIGISLLTANNPGDARIIDAGAEPEILESGENSLTLWAKADDTDRVTTVWCEIKPPGYRLDDFSGTEQPEMNLIKIVYKYYDTKSDIYIWKISDDDQNEPIFSTPGMYQIFFFAKDFRSGNVSPLTEIRVYKAISDNHPPDAFSLSSPEYGATVSPFYFKEEDIYMQELRWEGTADPDGDNFSYTLFVSKSSTFDDVKTMKIQGIKTSKYTVKFPVDWVDNDIIYWKVQAIDEFGAIQESDNEWKFRALNDSPSTGMIEFHIIDILTKKYIDGRITVWSMEPNTVFSEKDTTDGKCEIIKDVSPDSYDCKAETIGYASKTESVKFPEGEIFLYYFYLYPGDINGDYQIDLKDVVLSLQMITGSREKINYSTDVNKDGKLCLAEVIYMIQYIALLR